MKGEMMGMAIDTSRIEAMVAQLRNVASQAQGVDKAMPSADETQSVLATPNFADTLRAQLDQVSGAQNRADQLGKRFSMGDDSVNLSDVMIASQKANIGFQATLQVRNKLVSAYHDIMAMQI
jgi:flagellar hook-basal body complex protein FliE